MLGKRSRQPLQRTTSMSEITCDLNADRSETAPPSMDNPRFYQKQVGFGGHSYQWPSAAGTASRRTAQPRRASADFLETAHFLRSCSLCKRCLALNRDIYMRGDSAFCSLECRQLQMNHDERKGQCSIASKKEATSSITTVSDVPPKGETDVAL